MQVLSIRNMLNLNRWQPVHHSRRCSICDTTTDEGGGCHAPALSRRPHSIPELARRLHITVNTLSTPPDWGISAPEPLLRAHLHEHSEAVLMGLPGTPSSSEHCMREGLKSLRNIAPCCRGNGVTESADLWALFDQGDGTVIGYWVDTQQICTVGSLRVAPQIGVLARHQDCQPIWYTACQRADLRAPVASSDK